MPTFPKNTIQDWQTRGITHVSFFLTSGGCAGEKVSVEETRHPEMDTEFTESGITFYHKQSEQKFFEHAKITKVQGKWIVSNSGAILGHCSCGSSFKQKTGNALQDKAEAIKLKLRQKSHKHH